MPKAAQAIAAEHGVEVTEVQTKTVLDVGLSCSMVAVSQAARAVGLKEWVETQFSRSPYFGFSSRLLILIRPCDIESPNFVVRVNSQANIAVGLLAFTPGAVMLLFGSARLICCSEKLCCLAQFLSDECF
jgi:hypothetical protein